MAASKLTLVEEVTEDFCTCPICQEPFKHPKMLPCLHSYCQPCLERHINTQAVRGVFRCPICQREISAEKGVKTFLDNFFVAGLTEKLLPATIKPKCHFCLGNDVETDSTSKCIDCDDYLCAPCADVHTLTRLTKNHKVLSISEIQSGKFDNEIKSRQKVYCQHHNDEVLKFQCKKCQTPICVVCKTIDHDDHKCTTLENGVNEAKPVIESSVTELQSKVPMFSKLVDILEKETTTLDEIETSLSHDIKTRANNICASVRKQEQDLLEEVTKQIDIQRKQIEACKEKLEVTISIIQSSSDVATKILTHGKDAEILLCQPQLTARIQELQEGSNIELPAEMKMTLKHSTSSELDSAIRKGLGELDIIRADRDVGMYRDLGNGASLIQDTCRPELNLKLNTGTSSELDSAITEGLGNIETKRIDMDVGMHRDLHVGKATPQIKDTPELKLEFKTGIEKPYGIAVDNASGMLVPDFDDSESVHVYSKSGVFKHEFGSFKMPVNVLSLPDGKTVVCDDGAGKLAVLSGDKTVSEIPMSRCQGIDINKHNHIAVGCNRHVTIIQLDGTVIRKIEKHNGKKLFKNPHYLAFTSQGNLVVSDCYKHTITVLSPSGVPLYTYGREGSGDGQLNFPYGVCVDGYDNIIIADRYNKRIHLLNSDGKFVKYVVTDKDGLSYPLGVAINNDGDLVVTQYEGEVKVFKYLE